MRYQVIAHIEGQTTHYRTVNSAGRARTLVRSLRRMGIFAHIHGTSSSAPATETSGRYRKAA